MPRKNDFIDEVEKLISARVNEARLMAGWSNQDLAKHIGVTHQQAAKYCDGSNRITAGKLHFIAKALKLPIDYFYENGKGVDDTRAVYLKLFKNFAKLPKRQQDLISDIVHSITKITQGE